MTLGTALFVGLIVLIVAAIYSDSEAAGDRFPLLWALGTLVGLCLAVAGLIVIGVLVHPAAPLVPILVVALWVIHATSTAGAKEYSYEDREERASRRIGFRLTPWIRRVAPPEMPAGPVLLLALALAVLIVVSANVSLPRPLYWGVLVGSTAVAATRLPLRPLTAAYLLILNLSYWVAFHVVEANLHGESFRWAIEDGEALWRHGAYIGVLPLAFALTAARRTRRREFVESFRAARGRRRLVIVVASALALAVAFVTVARTFSGEFTFAPRDEWYAAVARSEALDTAEEAIQARVARGDFRSRESVARASVSKKQNRSGGRAWRVVYAIREGSGGIVCVWIWRESWDAAFTRYESGPCT